MSPSSQEVARALERILASPGFQHSERMARFLRLSVEKTLEGDGGQLKEYLIATEVFDRPQSFDPRVDTIVRVEARRLRRKLKEYYDGEGRQDPVRIEIPSPGYGAAFSAVAVDPEAAPAVRQPYRLVAAVLAGAVLLGAGVWVSRRTVAPPLRSIAVLPFLDLSPDKSQEYFCDGLMDQVLDSLTAVPGLRVVARTSTMPYRAQARDVREIGKVLQVATVLEGSVRKSASLFRVTLQLIRTADGYHLWSRTIEREVRDVFAVQDEIAQAVVSELNGSPRMVAVRRTPAKDEETFHLYLLGRHAWGKSDPAELSGSIAYFEQAIARDPTFALAYSGLSEVYSYMIDWQIGPPSALAPKAREAAEKALSLDESLAEAHTARGIAAIAEWDWPRAEKELRRAIELKPSFAYGVHWYGHYLEDRGRVREALDAMEQARALDPLSPMINGDLGMTLYFNREYDRALRQFDTARELDPAQPVPPVGRAFTLLALKRFDEARVQFASMKELPPMAPIATAMLGVTESSAGNAGVAEKHLRELAEMGRRQPVSNEGYAAILFSLGRIDEGFSWLERAFQARSYAMLYLKISPIYDPVRVDPRFQSLLSRMGLS